MKIVQYISFLLVLLELFQVLTDSNVILYAQDYNVTNDWKIIRTGRVHQVLLNRGRMGTGGSPSLITCEYPPGSNEEHISDVGIWVGGITPGGDTLVTCGTGDRTSDEFWPGPAPWDTIWTIERGEGPVDIGGTNTAGERVIYWKDYIPKSDVDFVTRYGDYHVLDPQRPTAAGYNHESHHPLYLDIIQTVFSWSSKPLNEVLIWTFYIVPIRHDIQDIFFGIRFDGAIGDVTEGVDIQQDDRSIYYQDLNMIVMEDDQKGLDGESFGALGFMFIPPETKSSRELQWTYRWGHANIGAGFDNNRYLESMASGQIMTNAESYYGGQAWLFFGSYDIEKKDTLRIQMAEILGQGVDGVLTNAETVKRNAEKGYTIPTAPPPPQLSVKNLNKSIRLNWKPTQENNSETYDDPGRADSVRVPFEGYRLYKSTQSESGPWTLLAEYDIPGNYYGNNIGLEYEYLDTGLLNNVEYYYTVTAYSKPDTVLGFPPQESSKFESMQVAQPGPTTPETVGEVAVVPNPYRGDQDYTEYNPPWEKSPTGRPWMEQDRKIQFINLPAACEIQIYSASGDFIKSIPHHNPELGYENWNLTSHVNQAIASGVYLYTVENLTTGEVQVGKFVIIK